MTPTGSNFDIVPDWIKNRIQMEYEVEAFGWLMKKDIRQGKATDAEICASIFCASLTAPLTHEAGQIYLYVCTRLLQERGIEAPDDIRVTELTLDQERTLESWRHELYRHRGRAETEITKAIREVFKTRSKREWQQTVETVQTGSVCI